MQILKFIDIRYICRWQVRELESKDIVNSDGTGVAGLWKAMQCTGGANVGIDESIKDKSLIIRIFEKWSFPSGTNKEAV